MSDSEKKGLELMAEAEKKLTGSKGFLSSVFGGGGNKTDDAIECYQRAANMFKMAKKWGNAGEAFSKAAELHLKSANRHDGASNYVDAANCYKKTDIKEAVTCLERAIEQYLEMGRFSLAAKHHQSIAEALEAEGDLEKAIHHYEQAADYYKGEESNAAANKALLKVAAHAAQMENYTKAIKTYEEVGAAALESSLLKYSAKEYFFRAAVCHLCVDILNCQQALERYGDMYPGFQDSREFKLMKSLSASVENEDPESFTETLKEYDSISRLESWYTTLFLRIKKTMNADGELC
ncbi:Soluble NSF attachment protein [Orchesella cincta]|uniref:Soluble NSF attachment protein n=1 Tax=Orchesella cincta TaxID=48709 RepID=A0A1D2MLY0_ORCCI|nr:Soluble NSF attachment protein [Orchesella cincta]